jgi:hypothetical protein
LILCWIVGYYQNISTLPHAGKLYPPLLYPPPYPPKMAFYQVPCFDVMDLVRQHMIQKRQEIRAGFWKHNGSNMRLVNNQINNIVLTLAKHGKRITPKQANPKTMYKYVFKGTVLHHGSGCLLNSKDGMAVARPIWGTCIWTYYVSKASSVEDYIVDKTEECQRNPRLTWALPARYGCYRAWKAKYLD